MKKLLFALLLLICGTATAQTNLPYMGGTSGLPLVSQGTSGPPIFTGTMTGTITATAFNSTSGTYQYNGGNLLRVDTNNYSVISDPSGADIFFGGKPSFDPINYYRNTTHLFQNTGTSGAGTYLSLTGTGSYFLTPLLVGIAGTPLATFQVHTATNQNLIVTNNGGLQIGAVNDPNNANVPLIIGASTISLNADSTLLQTSMSTINTPMLYVGPTWSFSQTTLEVAPIALNPTLIGTGASVNIGVGTTMYTTLGTSSKNWAEAHAASAQLSTAAGYTGTLNFGIGFQVNNPSISGSHPLPNYAHILTALITNGNGITSGSVTNLGLKISGHTSVPGAGGTLINYGAIFTQHTGTSAGTFAGYGVEVDVPQVTASGTGTAQNIGLYINGNGGSAGGGGVQNYSIYNNSTALSYWVGAVRFDGTISVGASAGVSCPSGINAATVVVVNGVMTHC